MTTKHICWQPLHNQTSPVDTSVGLLCWGGGDKQQGREHRGGTQGRERRRTADEKVEEKQRGTENEDREGKMNEEVGRRQKIERKGTASQ